MSILGVSGFFQSTECEEVTNNKTKNGWTNDCSVDVGLPNLQRNTSCNFDTTCSSFSCCVDIEYIKKMFELRFEIDSCEQRVTIGMERINVYRTFSELKFGKWDSFYLNGVFRFKYLIEDVPFAHVFIISARVEVYLDKDAIIMNNTLLNAVSIPYQACDLDSDFTVTEFSLKNWKAQKSIDENATLTKFQRIELLDVLGITPYLRADNCSSHTQVEGFGIWKKECTAVDETNLLNLSPTTSCSLHSDCTSVSCCMQSDETGKSVNFVLSLDYCNRELLVQIENMRRTFSLYEYNFGKSLGDRYNMCFLINITNIYIVDMWIRSDMSMSIYSVLRLSWKDAHGISGNTLTMSQKKILQRDFGLVRHMNEHSCVVQKEDQGFLHGWKTDCPYALQLANISEQYNISCVMQSSCSKVQCCIYIQEIDMHFEALFDLQPCEITLKVSFEKLSTEMNVKEIAGKVNTYDLRGN
ncbi:hypothetical protein MAR_020498 [Mya arenaria]|uniref:Uncharacterized protein n=1 Tax=Mya arenaria TaxID=6604 RepID=A0ABY7E7F4_MYAAR|nr:hypothetical protein MAR_020498 [Mya arenaria]